MFNSKCGLRRSVKYFVQSRFVNDNSLILGIPSGQRKTCKLSLTKILTKCVVFGVSSPLRMLLSKMTLLRSCLGNINGSLVQLLLERKYGRDESDPNH